MVVSLGTSVVRDYRKLWNLPSESNQLRLLQQLEQPGTKPEQIERVFPGATKGDYSSLLPHIDRVLERRGLDEISATVVELQALSALRRFGVSTNEVNFVAANEIANGIAAFVVCNLAERLGWKPVVTHLPFDHDLTPEKVERTTPALLEVIAPPDGLLRTSLIVIAGGMKAMVLHLELIAEAIGCDLVQLQGHGSNANLLPVMAMSDSVAQVVRRLVAPLAETPAEVQRHTIGAGSKASPEALKQMRQRTRRWIVGDVWQADRLFHMVRHDAEHGRRVDRLSNSLFAISPVSSELSQSEYDASVQCLSAASFLHDVGQRGGMLHGAFLRDHEHIRVGHGSLSRVLIRECPEDFGFELQPALGELTGLLCQFHQRSSPLSDGGRYTAWGCSAFKKSSDCETCQHLAHYVGRTSLKSIVESCRDEPTAVTLPISPINAVRIAAMLRVADAADIGVHRVDGRWEASTFSVEIAWRREYIWEEWMKVAHNHSGESVERRVHALLNHWDAENLAAIGSESPDLARMVDRIRGFDAYLRAQRTHVVKHQPFAHTVIARSSKTEFEVRLEPSEGWIQWVERGLADERFAEAATYIWEEYDNSRETFEHDDQMLRLGGVFGPQGREMLRLSKT